MQGLRERRGQRPTFVQFPFLQVSVRGDDPLALSGKGAPSVHEARHRFDGDPNGLDRGKRRRLLIERPLAARPAMRGGPAEKHRLGRVGRHRGAPGCRP
jgi:hypothetical protein